MNKAPEVKKIDFVRSDGTARTTNIFPVEADISGLDDAELQVAGNLVAASDSIAGIFADQNDPHSIETLRELEAAESLLRGDDREKLADYNTLFAMRNSRWDFADGLGFRLPISESVARGVMSPSVLERLLSDTRASDRRNFYPADMTEEEYESLGKDAEIVNSRVIRAGNDVRAVLNEDYYADKLNSAIGFTDKAARRTEDPDFKIYLSTKLRELSYGRSSDRDASSIAWLKNNGRLDFIMGTAIEQYLDKHKGIRGAAQSAVLVQREDFRALCRQVEAILPELEERAPWTHKRDIDPSKIPNMKFVDVLSWNGFYDHFPFLTSAQSLPNEEDIRQRHGSVNFVYVNVIEAAGKYGSDRQRAVEFLPRSALPIMNTTTGIKMTALHEIGHATGGMAITEEPSAYFGSDNSILEEARAEVFSMWAAPICIEKGIMKPEEELSGYYTMLNLMIRELERKPVDHRGSRNMMFHYFLKAGAIREIEEDSRTKYAVSVPEMRQAVPELLMTLGNVRATGDREGLARLISEYISTERQDNLRQRMMSFPMGGGIIFPNLGFEGGRFTRNLSYPSEYREQPKTLSAKRRPLF